MPIALTRRPGPRLAEGIVTHQARVPVDVARALGQWEGYTGALRANGWDVREVPPADDCPDAVFIEDALVVFDDLAVVARPGAAARRPEIAGMAAAAEALGLATVRVEAPGTLDGGDVLKVGRTVYVGEGGRTNAHAIAQLERLLAPRGWQVRAVPLRRVLHLKSAVTALPDGTILGHPAHVDRAEPFEGYLEVPEPEGAHVVLLGGARLLLSSSAPKSADLLAQRGYEPVPVDIGEFEKLEGCVTCLSVRVRSGASESAQ